MTDPTPADAWVPVPMRWRHVIGRQPSSTHIDDAPKETAGVRP